METKFKHSLMENSIIKSDLKEVIKFLKKKNQILTSGKKYQ